MKYRPKIGLEVHVELATNSKMFCRCENYSLGDDPNTRVCPVCLGLPGALPVINQAAMELGVKMALALHCQINEVSRFDRKNYFYPDLPKGYQISQFFWPLATGGWLSVYQNQDCKKVKINRLHMEEDTAKMTHAGDVSLLDFNRSGIPLMEIVTEPDITSSAQARQFLKNLKDLAVWVGVSHGRMQLGELRCDANISLLDENDKQLGEVVEIKNLNSFRNVEDSLNYEFKRQVECVEIGKEIEKETRGWDMVVQKTYLQRKKEYSHDYRYFPEPDLPVTVFSSERVEEIGSNLGLLPEEMREKMSVEYVLDDRYIDSFLSEIAVFQFYEKVLSELERWMRDRKVVVDDLFASRSQMNNKVAGFVLTELKTDILKQDSRVNPENLAELLLLFYRGDINNKVAKDVLQLMMQSGGDPSRIIEDNGWQASATKNDLDDIILQVIEENNSQVEEYKTGKEQLLTYFVGQVMKKTKGRANPKIVHEVLVEKLKS